MIDLERLHETPLAREPFAHLVVRELIDPEWAASIERDFPPVPKGGSFPPGELSTGPSFDALVAELEGDALRDAVASKFGLDLSARPSMVTVRGHARAKDGRIHTDSKWKLVTLLLYVNRGWRHEGGNLRLLRSPDSLEDWFADVPPELGTAVLFRCEPNAWHGHSPFVGERRAIQLNWVEDASWVRREQGRHRWTSKLKSLFAGTAS